MSESVEERVGNAMLRDECSLHIAVLNPKLWKVSKGASAAVFLFEPTVRGGK